MPFPIRRRFIMAGIFVMLTAVLSARGPQQGGASQVPQFRSGVDIVAIDVTVIDRTGAPVAGLAPGDFTVMVDGVPRRVVTAQFISHHETTRAVPAPSPSVPALLADTPDQPPVMVGRDIVIVIDEDSLETGDGLLAKRAASGFLDHLGPADRVGIATIPRMRSNFAMTADRTVNRRALADWVPGVSREPSGSYWIGIAEAFEIEGNDPATIQKVIARECKTDSRGRADATCGREVVQEAKQLAAWSHTRGTRALDALRTLGRALRQIDGPKTIVLVSGGLLKPESMSSFSDVEAEFAASQITLYTLYFEKVSFSAARAQSSPTLADDDRLESDGLEHVTSAAGGSMLRVIGTAEAYFNRVATELSASYLLGIEVTPADRNGRPHRVEIKVGRPGLDVRGRKQYVIPAEKPPAREPAY